MERIKDFLMRIMKREVHYKELQVRRIEIRVFLQRRKINYHLEKGEIALKKGKAYLFHLEDNN